MKRTFIFREVEGRTRAIEVTDQLREPPKPRVHLITDIIEPTFSHADCKWHTSASEMVKSAKAHGCIDIGNELPRFEHQRQDFDEEAFEREWAQNVGNL